MQDSVHDSVPLCYGATGPLELTSFSEGSCLGPKPTEQEPPHSANSSRFHSLDPSELQPHPPETPKLFKALNPKLPKPLSVNQTALKARGVASGCGSLITPLASFPRPGFRV